MTPQLKNILVSLEVARMAREKGFNEFCIAYSPINSDDILFNINQAGELLGECDNKEVFVEVPTHWQLIEWLQKQKCDFEKQSGCDFYIHWYNTPHLKVKYIPQSEGIDNALLIALQGL